LIAIEWSQSGSAELVKTTRVVFWPISNTSLRESWWVDILMKERKRGKNEEKETGREQARKESIWSDFALYKE
jgi:hypothetical protein